MGLSKKIGDVRPHEDIVMSVAGSVDFHTQDSFGSSADDLTCVILPKSTDRLNGSGVMTTGEIEPEDSKVAMATYVSGVDLGCADPSTNQKSVKSRVSDAGMQIEKKANNELRHTLSSPSRLCTISTWVLNNGQSRTFGDPSNPKKILFVMGLATSGLAWLKQAMHFQDDYHVCCYDNRGVGRSSAPLERYTTSLMAEDGACLLDHLEWTNARSIHIAGISMGGMISQELAKLVPERVLSLTLMATFSGGFNVEDFARTLPYASGFRKFVHSSVSFLGGRDMLRKSIMQFLYTSDTMDSCEQEHLDSLHRVIEKDDLKRIRFQPYKKLVLCGKLDDCVPLRNSVWLADHLNSELYVVHDAAHGVAMEKSEEVNAKLHAFFRESEEHIRKTYENILTY
ncbi:hypothetical protein SARC_08768 [Sphaeroforma arctica JP610]|uniref:AB hydrolase-1 domain-containing protein n=1 Tax=Sphaeroforma arctica JP610 TaxID=667725 RepID=A0A0L0FQI3_9EUKA|nr:hypothetical protein SARC_08768 [Sphaeroforma arctica JP610]KNC78811.1 hypothetical protein SARC_08768 [Sphaeroforma arctica JP610]|eukprot:XP_014152713.1 hypothetical protein SARC_08768 [Sphaeroforma arctica JP610]